MIPFGGLSFLVLFSTVTFCSKRPGDPLPDGPNKILRLEEDTIEESVVELIGQLFDVRYLGDTIVECEKSKALHLMKIFNDNGTVKKGLLNILKDKYDAIKLTEFTKALPSLVKSDIFALLFPWDKINSWFGFGIMYFVFRDLTDCYVANSKRFIVEENPHNKFRCIKAAYHSLYSMLALSNSLEKNVMLMANNSFEMIREYISVPLLQFLKKHLYLHPSFRSVNIITYNLVDVCKIDILKLESEFDRFIARAFAIHDQKFHASLSSLQDKANLDLRNVMGCSLYADFSFLPLASPDENMRKLNLENVLEVPDITTFHIAVPFSIYASEEGKGDDLVLSPLFWEVLKSIEKKKFHINEIFSLNLLPALRHVTPQIFETSLDDDFSSIIPQLPDDFFLRFDIRSMCPSNIRALRLTQVKNYKMQNLANLDWSYLNEEVKESIKNSDSRLTLLKNNIKISPANHGFFEDFSILSFIENDPKYYFLFHKNIAHLPENLAEEIKIFEMSHGELVNVSNTLANGGYEIIHWRDNAMRLRDFFNSIMLPMESDFEWYQPEIPEEYYKFNIEKIYGFEELFEGVPKGVWMAFFGFIKMEDALWNSIFVLGKEHIDLLLRLIVDRVFSLIFPWNRLAQSSPDLIQLATINLLSVIFPLQTTLLILCHIMCSSTRFVLDPKRAKPFEKLVKISNDWSSNPTLDSKYPQAIILALKNKQSFAIPLYLLRELYFDGAATRAKPLPEVYFRCANGAALLLVSILGKIDIKFCEDTSQMAGKLYSHFWKLISDENTGNSIMELIKTSDLTDLLRRVIEVNDCVLASPRWLTERAIPLYQGLSLQSNQSFDVSSAAIIRALPPSFFEKNRVILHAESTAALNYEQVKALESTMTRINWNNFNLQTRQSLLADKQFLLKHVMKHFSNLNHQNLNLFTPELFTDLLASCRTDTILLIVKGIASLPQVFEYTLLDFLRNNIDQYRHCLIKKLEVGSPAIRALLAEPVDEDLLEKTWNSKWSLRLVENTFKLSSDGPIPRTEAMIRRYIFIGNNFKQFLSYPWVPSILTENEWNQLSPQEFKRILEGAKRYKGDKIVGVLSNILRHFPVMRNEMKIVAVNMLVWGIFSGIRLNVTPEKWALLPNIGDDYLSNHYVGFVLAGNFTKMTEGQREEVESYLLRKIRRLSLWIKNGIIHRRGCPIFSKAFWKNEAVLAHVKTFLNSPRREDGAKSIFATGLVINWVNLSDPIRNILRELASKNFWALLCLLECSTAMIFGKEVWKSVSQNDFNTLMQKLREVDRNGNNIINGTSLMAMVSRNVMLNFGNLSADQQALVYGSWTYIYNSVLEKRN